MKLDEIRRQVDQTDDRLLELLSKRLMLVQKISAIKKKNALPVENISREKQILNRFRRKTDKLGLSFTFIKSIFKQILHESKRLQKITDE